MGGSGVQRPAKLAKYLRGFGWEPIILTPEPGAYINFDDTLLEELNNLKIRTERVDIRSMFHTSGKKQTKVKPSWWKTRLLRFITSWFFLPDNKKSWIEPAYQKAKKLISDEKIDAVFSTAPPYSNLIVAKKLKNELGIPVVMDFRDDWLNSHWIDYPTKWHYNKMKRLESETIKTADAITVVNERYKNSISGRYPGSDKIQFKVIPNGYDPENLEQVVPAGNPEKFTIIHSGRFYNVIQPDQFLHSVREVIKQNPEIEKKIALQFQGGLSEMHWKLINKLGLTEIVTDFGYVQHQQAVQNLMNADLLFLTLGNRRHMEDVTPGKLFEYMGTLKPILAFVPEGITSALLKLYGAAETCELNDRKAGAESILNLYQQWVDKTLPEGNKQFSEQFNRKYTAQQLSGVLNDVTKGGV